MSTLVTTISLEGGWGTRTFAAKDCKHFVYDKTVRSCEMLKDVSELITYSDTQKLAYMKTTDTVEDVAVIDSVASVSNVLFIDHDLDPLEVAGTITWTPPVDVSQVTEYWVYFAGDDQAVNVSSIGRSHIGNVSVGFNDIHVFDNTVLGLHTRILVYTRSSLAEQTSPVETALLDNQVSIAGIDFIDRDLDKNELGGVIYWSPPAATTLVTHYCVYLARDIAGDTKSQIKEDVAVGTNELLLADGTTLDPHTHIVVFTKSRFKLTIKSAPAKILNKHFFI
jgi:hypothetical protein